MDLLLAGSSVLDSHAVRQRLHNAPLTHDERLLLNEPGLMLLCPIRRSTAPASLLGLLLLGMRADLDAYHADDQRGLQRLAAAATLAVAREAEAVARARLEAQHRAAQHANEQLRAYAAQAQELAAANERNRIAREIHDGLGHYLTMVTWQLKGARKVFDTDPLSARESIEEAYASARDALREIQRSVATLREAPDHSHPPLLETLEALIEKNRSMCAGITFTTTGTPRPVPGPTSDALYRAVQEGLTNVRKHAEGAQVTVHLDYTRPQQVRLVIQDNGPGTTNLDGGYGLVGIRERIAQLSGTVVTETAPGQGFRLMIEVPA
jgi:signal transduction histidine kinase